MDSLISLFSNSGFTGALGSLLGILGSTIIAYYSNRSAATIKRLEIEAEDRRFIYNSSLEEHRARTNLAMAEARKLGQDVELMPAFLSVLFQEQIYTLLKTPNLTSQQKITRVSEAIEESEAIKRVLRKNKTTIEVTADKK